MSACGPRVCTSRCACDADACVCDCSAADALIVFGETRLVLDAHSALVRVLRQATAAT